MSIHDIGTWGITIAAFSYTALALGMMFFVPWYRSDVGRSMMASKVLLAILFSLVAAILQFDLDRDSLAVAVPRAIIYLTAPVVSAYQFYVLFIKHQIMGNKNRRVKSDERPGEVSAEEVG